MVSEKYGKKSMYEWLIRSAATIANPDLEILDASTKQIRVKCKFCGREYYETKSRILAGCLHSDDRDCGHKYSTSWRFNRTTIDRIVKTLTNISKMNKKLNLSVYDYADSKLNCQCSDCGHEFRMSIYDLERNECSCAKCKRIERKEKKKNEKYSPRARKKKLTDNSDNIKIIYYDNNLIRFKCKVCGNEYEAENKKRKRSLSCKFCMKNSRSRNISRYYLDDDTEIERQCEFKRYCDINGRLCKICICDKEPTYIKSEFNSVIEAVNPEITLIQDYVSINSEILYGCENCGSMNSEKPLKLFSGNVGCPNCRNEYADSEIKKYLDNNNLVYEISKVFEVKDSDFPYPNKNIMVDYFLPEYDIAVIYSGKFHFYPWISDAYNLTNYWRCCSDRLSKKGIKMIMLPFDKKNITDKLDREIKSRRTAENDKK